LNRDRWSRESLLPVDKGAPPSRGSPSRPRADSTDLLREAAHDTVRTRW